MEEKILQTKKNGMAVLLLTLAGYVAAIAAFVLAALQMERENYILGVPLLIAAIVYVVAGIFVLCGLKVLKPQEALVLTLFGDYIGTLKGEGFYWVNPFCTAAKRLSTAFESMYITEPMEFMTTVGRPTRIMSTRMSFLILKSLVKKTSMSSCFFAFAFIMTTMGISIATT